MVPGCGYGYGLLRYSIEVFGVFSEGWKEMCSIMVVLTRSDFFI
jgi:hypothetical protein